MALSRDDIVAQMKKLVGSDQVITDEQALKENSHDRYRKYETLMGIYELPLPAAVVKVKTAEQVSKVLSFCNENKINCCPVNN